MSEKKRDRKDRWRCKQVTFNLSPEEAYQLDLEVRTSGLQKQEYIMRRLMNKEIIVHPNIRVQKYLEQYLVELTNELKRLEKIEQENDVLENISYILKIIDALGASNKKRSYENDKYYK